MQSTNLQVVTKASRGDLRNRTAKSVNEDRKSPVETHAIVEEVFDIERRSTPHAALRHLVEAIALYERAGNERVIAPLVRLACEWSILLGFSEEADEWLARMYRIASKSGDVRLLDDRENLQANLSLDRGEFELAIRASRHVLGRSRSDSPSERTVRAAATHAGACVRLGRLSEAQATLERWLNVSPQQSGADQALAYIVRGDVLAWRLIFRWMSQNGIMPTSLAGEWTLEPTPVLKDRAIRAYSIAQHGIAGTPMWLVRRAEISIEQIELLSGASTLSFHRLEDYFGMVSDARLAPEISRMRMMLGVLNIVAARNEMSRNWLLPLVMREDGVLRKPIDTLALYFASIACERAGDRHNALVLLREFCTTSVGGSRIALGHVPAITPMKPTPHRASAADDLKAAELIAKVTSFIRENLDRQTSVTQLAREAGVSRRTLEYAFRRSVGTSPKKMVMTLRLEELRRHIEAHPDASKSQLQRLARQTGFASYSAFERAYRKAYQASPESPAVAEHSSGVHAREDREAVCND